MALGFHPAAQVTNKVTNLPYTPDLAVVQWMLPLGSALLEHSDHRSMVSAGDHQIDVYGEG